MTLTLTDVKAHLRVQHSDEDSLIGTYMAAAWDYVRAFTRQEWPGEEAPAAVCMAVLLLVGDSYENREAQSPVALKENKAVERLLWPHRSFA